MSTEWKPGTLALVTWSADGRERTDLRFRAARGTSSVGFVWNDVDGYWIGDATAKKVRPLVVIDPEDREQVEALVKGMFAIPHPFPVRTKEAQAALRAMLTPPLPEPTDVGTVVQADDGRRWVRVFRSGGSAPWALSTKLAGAEVWWLWSAMPPVKVLNPGWSGE